jgi:2-dehydropantoate 2-reductase
MRIAVVGAGSVGRLLAGLLARRGRDEVVLVARGEPLRAARGAGLTVEAPGGTFTVRPTLAVEEPAEAGPCDAVLVAVKAWQLAGLAPRLAPLLVTGGVAVPLQNGVEAADRLAAGLPAAQVAGGVIWVYAWAEGPDRVRQLGAPPRLVMGVRTSPPAEAQHGPPAEAQHGPPAEAQHGPTAEPSSGPPVGARLAALAEALAGAGMKAEVTADVAAATWEKALLIGSLGLMGAVTRAPAGPIRTTPETRALLAGLMAEVAAVARARGVALPAGLVERTLAFVDSVPADATASMQRDLAAGRPSELDDQPGAIVRAARAAGVPAPLHEALLAALLPQERAARGLTPPFTRT